MREDAGSHRIEPRTIGGSGLRGDRVATRAAPAALFLHGWDACRQAMSGPLAEAASLGFTCLDYDLRGHGATEDQRATVTPRQSLDDAIAAYDDLLASPGVDASAVALVGASFGGWLAALLTAHRPVRWLVLRVPALYPDSCWDLPKAALDDQALARYREARPSAASDRALAACAAFEGEVLVVWSGRDEVLPDCLAPAFQAAFPRAATLTVRRIRGADHGLSDSRHRIEYRSLLGDWLQASLRAARRCEVRDLLARSPTLHRDGA